MIYVAGTSSYSCLSEEMLRNYFLYITDYCTMGQKQDDWKS
jgi:hypothetical protein